MPGAPGEVNIVLTANPRIAAAGGQVDIDVVVNAGPSRPVKAVQVYLDFDASALQVVSLSGGPSLPQQLQSSFDNSLGRVNYAAGTLEDSMEAPFTLATVGFRAIAQTGPGGTGITFAPLAAPRQTRVAGAAGADATGDLTPVQVVVQ